MKKIYLILFLMIIVAITMAFFMMRKTPAINNVNPPISSNQNELPSQNLQNLNNKSVQDDQVVENFQSPLNRASERVTKKPFGIYIKPKTSPVQPEKFEGYHTGTDFEIFPEELDIDIAVHAVCSGEIILKKYASGYGGVVVESCELENQLIAVIYGHLNLASINLKTGDSVSVGDMIGNLGKAYSTETNGERKHLHLGFHKGSITNILGYVSSQNQLSDWIDPCLYVCK